MHSCSSFTRCTPAPALPAALYLLQLYKLHYLLLLYQLHYTCSSFTSCTICSCFTSCTIPAPALPAALYLLLLYQLHYTCSSFTSCAICSSFTSYNTCLALPATTFAPALPDKPPAPALLAALTAKAFSAACFTTCIPAVPVITPLEQQDELLLQLLEAQQLLYMVTSRSNFTNYAPAFPALVRPARTLHSACSNVHGLHSFNGFFIMYTVLCENRNEDEICWVQDGI